MPTSPRKASPVRRARPVAAVWRDLEKAMARYSWRSRKALRGPASARGIAALRRWAGVALPRDYEQSLELHDGMRDAHCSRLPVNEWLMPAADVLKQSRMMTELTDECGFKANSLSKGRKLQRDWLWDRRWLALTDNEGDGFVLDLAPGKSGKFGQVFYFYHDGARPEEVVADSFTAWLELLTRQVAAAPSEGATRGEAKALENAEWVETIVHHVPELRGLPADQVLEEARRRDLIKPYKGGWTGTKTLAYMDGMVR